MHCISSLQEEVACGALHSYSIGGALHSTLEEEADCGALHSTLLQKKNIVVHSTLLLKKK